MQFILNNAFSFIQVMSMANRQNSFTDMINGLPKEEVDITENVMHPHHPLPPLLPNSSLNQDSSTSSLVNTNFRMPNSADSSNNSIGTILPKRSQVHDLLKNGPLSAAICGAAKTQGNLTIKHFITIM